MKIFQVQQVKLNWGVEGWWWWWWLVGWSGASPLVSKVRHYHYILNQHVQSQLRRGGGVWTFFSSLQPLLGHFLFETMSKVCFHVRRDDILRRFTWTSLLACNLPLRYFHNTSNTVLHVCWRIESDTEYHVTNPHAIKQAKTCREAYKRSLLFVAINEETLFRLR